MFLNFDCRKINCSWMGTLGKCCRNIEVIAMSNVEMINPVNIAEQNHMPETCRCDVAPIAS